jgi:hypothetical protein
MFHVDDILFSFFNNQLGLDFKNALLTHFEGTHDGLVNCFVVIDVSRDDKHTHLTQTPLRDALLADFKMSDCNAVTTPMRRQTPF